MIIAQTFRREDHNHTILPHKGQTVHDSINLEGFEAFFYFVIVIGICFQ